MSKPILPDHPYIASLSGAHVTKEQTPIPPWDCREAVLLERTAPVTLELLGLRLMPTRKYSDFILRFDCRLPGRSNNGVAIRAPLEGNPAFAGMEIQVSDTRYYGTIKDYEVFGSVYGVALAKVGHLKPNGQWNTEEILSQGKHVKATLNGTLIVDIDLDSLGKRMIDRQSHSGLRREKGYIGYLGHTGRVEFRNIRIKELPTKKRERRKAISRRRNQKVAGEDSTSPGPAAN